MLCGELCRLNVLFRFCFDADLYADIEDFAPILCRYLHKKVAINSSDFFCVPYLKKKGFFQFRFLFEVGWARSREGSK